MYRIISSILLFIFIIVSSNSFAHADENGFSVRNGITFGMSHKEVNAIEVSNGISEQIKNNSSDEINYWPVSVAGYSGSAISYKFKNDALYEIVYDFNSQLEHEPTEKYATEIIKEIYGELREKYGKADHDGDGDIFYDICSDKFKMDLEMIGVANEELVLYCEWLLAYGNDFMIIDLYEIGYGFPTIDNYSTVLAYHYVSQSDVEEYMNQQLKAEEEKKQQRKNDL